MLVLVTEHEPTLAVKIRQVLSGEGHVVDGTASGEAACDMALATSYDAIVLDALLPGIDGFATCARLRDAGVTSPVLILTATGERAYHVAGLDAGADDCLARPFTLDELLARLHALGGRGKAVRAPTFRRTPASRPRLTPRMAREARARAVDQGTLHSRVAHAQRQ